MISRTNPITRVVFLGMIPPHACSAVWTKLICAYMADAACLAGGNYDNAWVYINSAPQGNPDR
jgi:hypothetical protein